MNATAWLILVWIVVILVGVILLAIYCAPEAPEAPKVKSHDAIAEEIRAEKIELHNVSREYADLQLRNELESYPAAFVDAMLSAAFRSGALWQQRRPH